MKKLITLGVLLFAINCSAQNLKNGLVAYYPFNNNFNDHSVNGNNATQHGGITFGVDKFGNPNSAAFFDGIDDWVEANATAQNTISSAGTISFQFKTVDNTSKQNIISKSNYTYPPTYNFQYHIGFNQSYQQPTDNMLFATTHFNDCNTQSALAQDYIYDVNPVATTVWNCMAFVFDHGVKKLYLNGSLVATHSVTAGNTTNIDSCVGGSFRMGTWWEQDPLFFKGYLDEVRIYNRVLAENEIMLLCTTDFVTSVNDVAQNEGFTVSPNPASTFISLNNLSQSNNSLINVYNVIGENVFKGFIKDNKLNIEFLPKGLYIINVNQNGIIYSSKFTKE